MPPVKKPLRSRDPTFIKQWRTYKGFTQEQIAERVGVDPTTVGRVEAGESPYNQDFLEQMAFAIGVDVDDLLKVNPLEPDPPRLVYAKLRKAPPDVQRRALRILETLLEAG